MCPKNRKNHGQSAGQNPKRRHRLSCPQGGVLSVLAEHVAHARGFKRLLIDAHVAVAY